MDRSRGGPSWLLRADPGEIPRVTALVQSIDRDLGRPSGLQLQRIDQDASLAPVIDQQTRSLQIVALVALAVGGIGMLSVGLVTVRERGREFGVRRALGATKSAIFVSVAAEALLTALVAAVLSTVFAVAAVQLLPEAIVLGDLPVPPNVGLPLKAGVRGIAAGLSVGLLAGLVPADRAIRQPLIKAMRE